MTQLKGAVVLITGAAGGFGQELTRQLLITGSRLILTDLDLDILQKRVDTIINSLQQSELNGEVISCLAADISSLHGCQNLYEQVKNLGVDIDILINNAGVAVIGEMTEIPLEKWENLMQINLLAPMRLTTLFSADMITRQTGHIVNISSMAGWVSSTGMIAYSTSKFGLRGFSEGLFNELKNYQIKVTVVYPFFSRTPLLLSKRYGKFADETKKIPKNLITNPRDVMRRTIHGIVQNKKEVFPDIFAQSGHLLKRYFPLLLDSGFDQLVRRLKKDAA